MKKPTREINQWGASSKMKNNIHTNLQLVQLVMRKPRLLCFSEEEGSSDESQYEETSKGDKPAGSLVEDEDYKVQHVSRKQLFLKIV